MKHSDFAPFDGDGRFKKYPPAVRFLEAGKPTAVTNAVARQLIEMFVTHGNSNHSQHLTTLWVLITWCQYHNKPFEVWCWRAGDLRTYGIFLDKIPNGFGKERASMVLSSVPKADIGHLDLAVRWRSGNSSITASITQDQYQRILAITQEKES